MRKIAVVEDEADLRDLLKLHLEREGYEVILFDNGDSFLDFTERNAVDMVLLDLMLPGIDGLEVCKIMRNNEATSGVPIIMLTAKSTEADIVVGLEVGADDYLTKPFSTRELVARVKAVFRRITREEPESFLRNGELELYLERFSVTAAGKPVELTATEFNILHYFMSRPGRVLTRNQILSKLGSDRQFVIDRTVDVHILNIRKKLGRYGNMIITIRGVGYKMVEE